jgi:hypothetical protein
LIGVILGDGFFGKKQYAVKAAIIKAVKKELL